MKGKGMGEYPEFLYHGTSASHVKRILEEGEIRPRGESGKTNYKHTVESNPRTVYLTDAYPLYFGINATKKKNEPAAVIQLDVARLNKLWLVPDEDVLEQAGRKQDGIPGTMKQRTLYYRKQMINYAATDKWQVSLTAMGTCGSMQPIPVSAITRIAYVDPIKAAPLWYTAMDPSICLANYRFCGPKYRNLTRLIFGLPAEPDDLEGVMAVPEGLPAEGRKVYDQINEGRQATLDLLRKSVAEGVRIEEINP